MKSKLLLTLTLFLSLNFTHAEDLLPIDNNIYCYAQSTQDYKDLFCIQKDEEVTDRNLPTSISYQATTTPINAIPNITYN